MKFARITGLNVLVLMLAALACSGPPASGQSQTGFPGFPQWQSPNAYSVTLGEVSNHDPEVTKLLNEEGKSEREAAGLVKEYLRVENESDRAKIRSKLTDVL